MDVAARADRAEVRRCLPCNPPRFVACAPLVRTHFPTTANEPSCAPCIEATDPASYRGLGGGHGPLTNLQVRRTPPEDFAGRSIRVPGEWEVARR